ncbi:hypothetical protein E2C01_073702 [Portunus trituberculatus]|uniref:Uncharacterized protein n=1 Tax=Portunus trituberculatus TaxID=210409 RepID=A0A5B7IE85_PORTR|nr:hypothetical protein [Portunus trituberculatus]
MHTQRTKRNALRCSSDLPSLKRHPQAMMELDDTPENWAGINKPPLALLSSPRDIPVVEYRL